MQTRDRRRGTGDAIRILITGNQGFIGPVLTRMAKTRGHHVTGLDIGYFETCVSRPEADAMADAQIVRDIREVKAQDLMRTDAVIHLAGLSNDPMGALKPQITYNINLDGTLRLARLAKAAGVKRFVFASSCSIYGAAGRAGALNETAPLEPVSAYAMSKVRSEVSLGEMADSIFSPVFLRNATAYGLGARPRFDLVVNNLSGWAFTRGLVKVMSDGTPWRPLVHIEDISLAALCAVEAPQEAVHNQAFNIGRTDANYQVRTVAEHVQAAFPQARLEITGETGGDPRSYRVDFTKALTALPGFTPQWTLKQGVDEVASWLKSGALANTTFEHRKFIRLKQLQHGVDKGWLDTNLRRVTA